MTPTDEQIRLAIAEQAADWFVAHRTETLDEGGQEEFAEWLKDSRLPVEAWIAAATSQAPSIEAQHANTPGGDGPAPNVVPLRRGPISPPGRRARRWVSGWRLAGALVISAIALAAFLVSFLLSGAPARAYETAHGAQRTWQLADGTMLRLNTDSAVEVRFSDSERVVELARGQAFFKVAHYAHRPFRVIAGQAEVIAVGAQFDVYRHGQTIQVTVLSGRVAVFSGHTPPPSDGAALPSGALYLAAGQQVRILGGALEDPSRVDLQQAEFWLRGQIAFEQLPLGEVAAQLTALLCELPGHMRYAYSRCCPDGKGDS